MENGKVKFIRVRGRVVPVRQKADGNVDKRHVSDKALAKSASKVKKPKHAGKGAIAGGLLGYMATKKPTKTKIAIGALFGAALGSIRLIKKQDVANKLKKKK